MRFLLAFVFSFISVFAVAQTAPPMILGGPQGINVTRALVTNWLSIPTYTDTLNSNPGGAPWPGRGYIIQVVKTRDTSLWQYTGQRWSRIAGVSQETFTKLLTGGDVNQVGTSRQYTVSPSTYYINGVFYTLSNLTTVTSASKAANANGRIDVITLATSGVEIIQGAETPVPLRPSVGANRIELAAIYYRPFDTVPRDAGNGITSVYRILGRDSLYFTSRDTVFAIKDSIGISRNDTAAMLNNYKFTAANGLTKDSTVFRLGGSLNQNTDINLNTRRLTIIGGVDTTRFFANGRVSIGGTPDSANMLRVNGNARVNGFLRTSTSSNSASVIVNHNNDANPGGAEGSLIWGSAQLNIPSNVGIRNVVISPFGQYSSLTGQNNVLIGRESGRSISAGNWNVMIGSNAGSAITTGVRNTIIGGMIDVAAYPNYSNSIHLVAGGYENGRPDTALFGLTSGFAFIGGGDDGQLLNQPDYIKDYYFGGGHRVRLAKEADVNFYAPSAKVATTDSSGANFTINAGRGTGTGLGGSVIFRTSSPTTSGTTLQTLTERARISQIGNLLVGTSTDDTSSLVNIVSTTKGFLQPRMTNTQRDAITTPATGLQLFSTTDSANYVYRGTGGGWQKIANEISASDTLDFPSTNNGNESDLTITVTGASEGDVVSLGIPNSVNLNHSCFTAWVSATNTVTVRFNNYGTGALNPVSATFKVKVFK